MIQYVEGISLRTFPLSQSIDSLPMEWLQVLLNNTQWGKSLKRKKKCLEIDHCKSHSYNNKWNTTGKNL